MKLSIKSDQYCLGQSVSHVCVYHADYWSCHPQQDHLVPVTSDSNNPGSDPTTGTDTETTLALLCRRPSGIGWFSNMTQYNRS